MPLTATTVPDQSKINLIEAVTDITRALRSDITQIVADVTALDAAVAVEMRTDDDVDWTGATHTFSNNTAVKVGDLGVIGNTGKALILKALTGQTVDFQVADTDIISVAAALITLSQAIKIPNGSVGTPGLHFAGDVDTGVGLISSKLALIFGGAVRMNNDGTTWDAQAQNFLTTGKFTSLDPANPSIFKSGVKFKDSGTGSDTLSYREERGTWTPALSYLTVGTSSWTFSNQVGVYHKFGKWVECTGLVSWTAHTKGTGASLLQMSLPFTSSTTANKYHSGAMAVATGITSPTNAGQIQSSHVQPNMNKAFFAGHGSQGMFFSTTSAGFAVANAGTMIMTIKYEAST